MKTITKQITEIKRNWLGMEVSRVTYDIEVPQSLACDHHFVYKDKHGVERTCELCGRHQAWTGGARPIFEQDYLFNTWINII